MLFSLLQMSPRKWSDVLKDPGHRLFADREEQLTLQRTILRERIFESVFDFRGGRVQARGSGIRSHHLVEEEAEHRPLFVCLGDPGGIVTEAVAGNTVERDGSPEAVDVYDGIWLADLGDSDSEASSNDEQWEHESLLDPISVAEMQELSRSSPAQVQHMYWEMRRAIRRFRAATGSLDQGDA